MTNFEHMTEEEKRQAILYGFHKENGVIKICPGYCEEGECPQYGTCPEGGYCKNIEIKNWIDSEYKPPKTENEKFCETLKVGEVIVVSDYINTLFENFTYHKFAGYDKEHDLIVTNGVPSGRFTWKHGRKQTTEERGE